MRILIDRRAIDTRHGNGTGIRTGGGDSALAGLAAKIYMRGKIYAHNDEGDDIYDDQPAALRRQGVSEGCLCSAVVVNVVKSALLELNAV